ncbi:MAG: type I restriction enzyme HsdR N-terminal domain-containing protein [Chlamydiales bacterium]|nr:type I restriction enzyme HsdR N-terminal domain-containing protein [Chlamydiales bacterium]
MELSKRNNRLFDPVRKKWVEPEPEEVIRQELIQKMVGELGYPLSLLSVEKELSLLPHLRQVQSETPKRRADLIAFAKEIHPDHPLFPLLMVECKAVPLTPKFANQVVGYNSVVKAPYLALANGEQVLTGHFDSIAGHFRFESGLPSYKMLLAGVKQMALK